MLSCSSSSMSNLDETRFKDITGAGTFRKRCDQILQEIQSRNGGVCVDIRGVSNQELKDEYNRLSHQLDDLLSRPSVDPLAVLPPEIWTDILRDAATNVHVVDDLNDIYVPNLTSTDNLLALTCVSKDWSTKLLTTAMLWTSLTIGLGEADAQAKLGTSLCLSKDLPLKLTVQLSPCQWDKNLSLMLPHTERVQEIVFGDYKGGNVTSDTLDAFLDQFFSSLGLLPALKTVSCGYTCLPNWRNIFANAPYLTTMSEFILPLSVIKYRPALLRSCKVEGPSSEIITHLEDLAQLDELAWSSESETMDSPICRITGPRLLGLRHIWGPATPTANFFTVIQLATNLETLFSHIENTWQSHYDIFRLFPRLPRLRELRLFVGAISDNFVWPDIETTGTAVTTLLISYTPHFGESRGSLDNQEALFAVLPLYFPQVTRVYLNFIAYSAGVAAFIRSAQCLRSLKLSWARQPDCEVSLKSSTLVDLTIDGDDNLLSRLVNVACPLLSKLSLDQSYHTTSMCDWSRQRSTYSRIERLKIRTSQSLGEIYEFRTLRNLQVEGAHTISSFLLSLIFDPIACPMLSELKLSGFPEWDILFIMLERRNYIPTSRGISRIETLILPSPIPPILLAPLTELLAGRFTERPSNWELSFSSIIEVYFDLSITGCETCLELLSSCSTSTIIVDYPYMCHRIHAELAGSDSSVPTEVWEWLKRRQERVDEWNRRAGEWGGGRAPNRVIVCPQVVMFQQPFIVTGHSLG